MGPSTYIPFGHNRLLIRKIKTKGKVSIEINLGKKIFVYKIFCKYGLHDDFWWLWFKRYFWQK